MPPSAIEAMIEKIKDNTPPEFVAIVHPDDRDKMAAILKIRHFPRQ